MRGLEHLLRVSGRRGALRGAGVGVAVALLVAGAASAEELDFFIGQKPKPYIDPAGYFAVVLPSGLDCEAQPRRVRCQGNRGKVAALTIEVRDVPPSATNEIVLLNEMERFKQKPHFEKIAERRTTVDKTPALTAAFSYDALGNVERSVGVQALYLVRGGKLYVIHFESRLQDLAAYRKDLEVLYASFKPARLDASGNPILEELRPHKVDVDTGTLPDIERALKSSY